ncbi:MAG: 1,4-alpha-glucan branching protein GlgB [Streptococcaceae bacterium]|nr:1,4-alpha-glucan branching protein GlgB [Streptococcaceae bacterium]
MNQQEITFNLEETKAVGDFLNGENFASWKFFAHQKEVRNGKVGYTFRVWAPNALEVFLVGDFTYWWEEQIPMQKDEASGIWSCFTTLPKLGQMYKFKIRQANGNEAMRIDPYAYNFEKRPGAASIITDFPQKNWQDDAWMERRKNDKNLKQPHNIYFLHATSWKTHADGRLFTFKDLKDELLPYLKQMHFNAILFMPLMNHINASSLGYHVTGFYALCPDFGSISDFQDFVEAAHLEGIAVYMDFPIGQFSKNPDGLTLFDGTPSYEYTDRNRARNLKHSTKNFDLGKKQVQSYLISSAFYWLETFHLDGFRINSLASMIYRNLDGGPWTPNAQGENENIEGIAFLKKLTQVLHEHFPTTELIAQEHTGEQKITNAGFPGLGFDYKWRNDWMQAVKNFYGMDPIYRKYHYDQTLLAARDFRLQEYSIQPLVEEYKSEEKKSVLSQIFGEDIEMKLAQLKNLLLFQKTFPGAVAVQMGINLGQIEPFEIGKPLNWELLENENFRRFHYFNQRLNELYIQTPAFYESDFEGSGFELVDGTSKNETIFAYKRQADNGEAYYVILNMTPVEYPNYYLPVSELGIYDEIFNTQTIEFGGKSKIVNLNLHTQKWTDNEEFPQFIKVDVPGFAAIIIKPKQ